MGKIFKSVKLNRFFLSFFKHSLFIVAIFYLLLYLILVFFRIQYPFELEWMEGASVDHVIRILSGMKLYVPPSLEFVPFIYPPLYFYLSALLSNFIGAGFFPLRLISFLSSLGCFVIIYLIVKNETGSRFKGILSAALFAATFRLCGAWLDIGRVDSLFLFFILIGSYILKFKNSKKYCVLAGVFFSLAFLTKQIALFIILPLMLYTIIVKRKNALLFITSTFVLSGLATFILNIIHNGWYLYYTFNLPNQHSFMKDYLIDFWTKDIFFPLFIVFLISLLFFVIQFKHHSRSNFCFYFILTLATIGSSWISRLHFGGYNNVLMPAYATLAILFGISLHTIQKFITNRFGMLKGRFHIYLYIISIIQFLLLFYNPADQVPTSKDLNAGNRIITFISKFKGDVLIPNHGFLASIAGKKSHAHTMAIFDILRGKDDFKKNQLINDVQQSLQKKKFAVLILDNPIWFKDEVKKYYKFVGYLFSSENEFFPITGAPYRPQLIFVPKNLP